MLAGVNARCIPRALGNPGGIELLIIRHAIAVEHVEGEDDALRGLTGKGTRRFRQAVRGLDRLGVELAHVVHSPWRRAVDSAGLLAPIVKANADAIVGSPRLIGSPGPDLIADLVALGADGTVAVVGHEPWLGELIALLCFADARRGEALPLKKGGVAWLEGTLAPGGMTMHALLPPRVLRQAGRA